MNKRIHLFSVKRGRLHYDDKPIGACKCHPGFERLRFEDDPLSEEGANGVIFRATHRTLGIQQAVKVWRPEKLADIKRAKAEAKKNANRDLGNSIAHVNDAGIYEYPSRIFFAVMEIVNGATTLKEWIASRNRSLKECSTMPDTGAELPETLKLYFSAQALNIASGLLLCASVLHMNDITHGDMHDRNLLVTNCGGTRTDLLTFRHVAGIGTLNPAEIRIIDIGTSKAEGTNRTVGIKRDIDKLIHNTRRILSPLLSHFNTSLKQWLNLDITTGRTQNPTAQKRDNTPASPIIVTGDLLRLTMVLNLILGYATNTPNKQGTLTLNAEEVSEFNQLISSSTLDSHISSIPSTALNALRHIGERSTGLLINWPEVWATAARRYPALSSYSIQLNEEEQCQLFRTQCQK